MGNRPCLAKSAYWILSLADLLDVGDFRLKPVQRLRMAHDAFELRAAVNSGGRSSQECTDLLDASVKPPVLSKLLSAKAPDICEVEARLLEAVVISPGPVLQRRAARTWLHAHGCWGLSRLISKRGFYSYRCEGC
jgi:hypothetical protein